MYRLFKIEFSICRIWEMAGHCFLAYKALGGNLLSSPIVLLMPENFVQIKWSKQIRAKTSNKRRNVQLFPIPPHIFGISEKHMRIKAAVALICQPTPLASDRSPSQRISKTHVFSDITICCRVIFSNGIGTLRFPPTS